MPATLRHRPLITALLSAFICFLFLAGVLAGDPPLPPPDAVLDWWTIDAGTPKLAVDPNDSTNTLLGTIGQHDWSSSEVTSGSLALGFLPASNPGTIRFSSDKYYAHESDASAHISVLRARGVYGAAAVEATVNDGTALSPDEFTAATHPFSWAHGNSDLKEFDVSLSSDDDAFEANKTIDLRLKGGVGGSARPEHATLIAVVLRCLI